MHFSIPKVISLQLNDEVAIELDLKTAFSLALFCTRAHWKPDDILCFFLSLNKEIKFTDPENWYPDNYVKAARVYTYLSADKDRLLFVFGESEQQQVVVKREELLSAINAAFVSCDMPYLQLPTVPDEIPEDELVPTGFSLNGRDLAITARGYISLVSFIPGDRASKLEVCDTQIFYGNVSVPRHADCSNIALMTRVYTDGYYGAAIRENMAIYLYDGTSHAVDKE